MKKIICLTILASFFAFPNLTFGWYVHVTYGPATACPGTTYVYAISASPNSGLLEINCTNCLIKDPESGTWQGALIRSSQYGDQINGFDFEVKFDDNESWAVISAQLTFLGGTATVKGNKTVTLGPRPTTPAIITGDGFLANCISAVNTYNLSNISYNWSLDDWYVSSPLTTINETTESVQVTTYDAYAYGNATLTAEMHYTEQGITCGVKNI